MLFIFSLIAAVLSKGAMEKVIATSIIMTLTAILAGFGFVGKWAMGKVDEYWEERKQQRKAAYHPAFTREQHEIQAARNVALHQYTQYMCDRTADCDHVSVYAAMNGEYLKSGDSVEKMMMQSEGTHMDSGEARYIQSKHRLIFTVDIPDLMARLCRQPYVLNQQGVSADEYCNRMMRLRGYKTTMLFLITCPSRALGGTIVLGMVELAWKGHVINPSDGPPPHVTPALEGLIARYKLDLADIMDISTETRQSVVDTAEKKVTL